jgi:hypothetical protein
MSRLTRASWALSAARLVVTDALDLAWFHLTPGGRRTQRDLAAMTRAREVHPAATVSSWATRRPGKSDPFRVPFGVHADGSTAYYSPSPVVGISWWQGMTPETLPDPLEPLAFNVRDVRREIEDARLARVYAEASVLDPWPDEQGTTIEETLAALEERETGRPVLNMPPLPTLDQAREVLAAHYRAIVDEGIPVSGPALSDLAWSRLTNAEKWVLDRDRYMTEENAR